MNWLETENTPSSPSNVGNPSQDCGVRSQAQGGNVRTQAQGEDVRTQAGEAEHDHETATTPAWSSSRAHSGFSLGMAENVKHTPLRCNYARPSHRSPGLTVHLNVYHLGQNVFTRGLNALTRNGAYHSGVEIGGKEWAFGMTLDDYSTGVTWNIPKEHPDHSFSESLLMGTTSFSNGEVYLVIEELKQRWLGCRYHVLTQNCHHFSAELCRILGVGSPPDWLNKLASKGNEVSTALDGEPAEYDGGEAFFDFVSHFVPAIRDFFSGDMDSDESGRSSHRKLRSITNTRYSEPQAPDAWESQNGNNGGWFHDWHNKLHEYGNERGPCDELDVLARTSHSSNSRAHSEWTKHTEGLRECDSHDHRAGDIEHETFQTSTHDRATPRVPTSDGPSQERDVWDILWPSPKGTRTRRSRSAPDRPSGDHDIASARRRDEKQVGRMSNDGTSTRGNARPVEWIEQQDAPKEKRRSWWGL